VLVLKVSFGLRVRACVVNINIGCAESILVPAIVHLKVKTPVTCPLYTGVLISP